MQLTEKEQKILKGLEILECRIWFMYLGLSIAAIVGMIIILVELIWKASGDVSYVYLGVIGELACLYGFLALHLKMRLYRIIKKFQNLSSTNEIFASTNSQPKT
ncbi:MAG: hypothetical protein HY776_01660 [Actinobacteria bacterium]|nr:hypothetical protein [Actinomycetota bacterium]